MIPPERRKWQARESQRRSRARRRAHVDVLQARVWALSRALEEVTDACLQFSDAVVSALEPNSDDRYLRAGVQPFINKALATARMVEQDDSADEGDTTESNDMQTDQQSLRIEQDPGAKYDHLAVPSSPKKSAVAMPPVHKSFAKGAMSPRLTYGLWPELRPTHYGPPWDITVYLPSPSASDVPFRSTLYWNTLFFAHDTLVRREQFLSRQLFRYSLRFSSVDEIVDRIQYRLQYKPTTVILCVAAPDSRDTTERDQEATSALLPGTSDVEHEALDLAHHHLLIKQAMSAANEDSEQYLDAAGVEHYLHSRWGLVMSPLRQFINDPTRRPQSSHVPPSVKAGYQMIQELAIRSRCLGDRIGFPVQGVDEVALKYLYTPL